MDIGSAISIRRAEPEDIADLAAMEQAAFRDPWATVSLHEALRSERNVVFLAYDDGAACGHVIATVVGDEGELDRVGVAPAWRGRGVGKTLIHMAAQECRRHGVLRLFLEVRVGNGVALRLYERAGFHQVGRRRRYYSDGEDAIVMEKLLNELC
jgi:ribosomal-protein-alanine N-acetyltransferase